MTMPVEHSVTRIYFLFKAVTKPVFSKASGLYYKWQWQILGWSVFLEKLEAFPINMNALLMAEVKSVLQSVFGEASDLYYKCQPKSLWLGLFSVKFYVFSWNVSEEVCDEVWLRQGLFFVKLQTYTVNGRDKVCDEVCFSEASGHYYEWQCPSLWQILWQNLFLV